MVPHSMTLSDPNPQFQGHRTVQRRISRKHDVAQIAELRLVSMADAVGWVARRASGL